MQKEIIGDWVKVFESPVIMEAEVVESRLRDEEILYQTKNKKDFGYTVGFGQNMNYNAGNSIKIFVQSKDNEKALNLINEDRSELLDDPDLDFGNTED